MQKALWVPTDVRDFRDRYLSASRMSRSAWIRQTTLNALLRWHGRLARGQTVGRPLMAEHALAELEKRLGRTLGPGKPGRRPSSRDDPDHSHSSLLPNGAAPVSSDQSLGVGIAGRSRQRQRALGVGDAFGDAVAGERGPGLHRQMRGRTGAQVGLLQELDPNFAILSRALAQVPATSFGMQTLRYPPACGTPSGNWMVRSSRPLRKPRRSAWRWFQEAA